MTQRPYDFLGRPGTSAPHRRQGRPAQHLDHRDRRRSPADLLRDHQRLGIPSPGLPDKRWISIGAARPRTPKTTCGSAGPRRRDRQVRPRSRADRVRRALAHVLAAASSCAITRRRASNTSSPPMPPPPTRAARVVPRGRPCPGTGTMPEFYRFRPEARFGHYLMMIGALGEGDCRATSASTASTRTRSAPARYTCGSTGPRAASAGPGGHPRRRLHPPERRTRTHRGRLNYLTHRGY